MFENYGGDKSDEVDHNYEIDAEDSLFQKSELTNVRLVPVKMKGVMNAPSSTTPVEIDTMPSARSRRAARQRKRR